MLDGWVGGYKIVGFRGGEVLLFAVLSWILIVIDFV